MTKKLFVFDLDFTLWDAGGVWCDCTSPPYKRYNGYVLDSSNRKITLYPEVWDILKSLKIHNRKIAIASRTEQPTWAREILELFDLRQWFDFEEIFPDRKIQHFYNIQEKSGITFEEMVFFDDEQRNISDVSTLGVTTEWVTSGIKKILVDKYL